MKKLLCAVAVLATVAAFTSCNKKCTCKTYASGVVVTTTEDVELEKGKKCKDMNTYVIDSNGENKTGLECK